MGKSTSQGRTLGSTLAATQGTDVRGEQDSAWGRGHGSGPWKIPSRKKARTPAASEPDLFTDLT